VQLAIYAVLCSLSLIALDDDAAIEVKPTAAACTSPLPHSKGLEQPWRAAWGNFRQFTVGHALCFSSFFSKAAFDAENNCGASAGVSAAQLRWLKIF
jgi:hypothetical protein